MKKIYIIASAVVLTVIVTTIVTVRAQDVDNSIEPIGLFNAMSNATIHQDSCLTQLMEDHWNGRVRGEIEMDGWRVQIYSSNSQLVAKQEAEALKKTLENEISEPIYINFIQPFWKVRIGNFQTLEEAKAYRNELVQQFPELQAESYAVRDIITVKK
ncbi:MAG: SPOR domain-containing protein [Paludibacteraceae bacterium]|nr:SPOR domain-containing protein [Paludibacteraceae bacterium]